MHLCHRKCVVEEPCTGSDCFCEGLVPELDDEESPDCYGIDMKADKPRCVLNYDTCEADQRRGLLRPDPTYNFHFLYEVPEPEGRALVGRQGPMDPGTSSPV